MLTVAIIECAGRMAARNSQGGDVANNDRSSLNDGAFADTCASQDDDAIAEPYEITDLDIFVDVFAWPVRDVTAVIVIVEARDHLAVTTGMEISPDGNIAIARDRHAVEIRVVAHIRVLCENRMVIDASAFAKPRDDQLCSPRMITPLEADLPNPYSA